MDRVATGLGFGGATRVVATGLTCAVATSAATVICACSVSATGDVEGAAGWAAFGFSSVASPMGAASAAVTPRETTRPEEAAITAPRRPAVPAWAWSWVAMVVRGVFGRTAARCRPWARLDKGLRPLYRLRGELSGSGGRCGTRP